MSETSGARRFPLATAALLAALAAGPTFAQEQDPARTPARPGLPAGSLVPEAAPLVDPLAEDAPDALDDDLDDDAGASGGFRDTLLSSPPPPVGAAGATGDLAYGAYQRGYFLTAFHRATQRLERSPRDAAAMTLLGELYAEGLGIARDFARANDWYDLAAREGDANALFALAMNTIEGRGRERDPEEGRRLLGEAAQAGHPRAAFNLALVLLGSETPEDLTRAASLMRTAAEAEIGAAQHALGVLLAEGRGIEADRIAATAWFSRAARNGDVSGMVEFAIALFNGDGIAADEAEAARWFREAAFHGNAIAQNRLARMLVSGRGVPAAPIEAAAWHMTAASQGLSDAWLDEALADLDDAELDEARALAQRRVAGL